MNPKHDKTRHALVLLMTLVAGCVDAIAFVNAGVFPANMSGNTIVFAVSLLVHGAANFREAHAGLVMLGFCCGAAAASLLIRSERNEWSRSVNFVILLAGLILLGWGVSMSHGNQGFSLAHLFLIASAMGMQSATALHLNFSGAGTTTAVTSTLTTVVSRTVHHLHAACFPGFQGSLSSPWFPLLIFCLYLSGALIGSLQRGVHTAVAIFIAGFLLAGVAITAEILSLSVRKSS